MAEKSGKVIAEYTIKLPLADDSLGRWMEENGANLSLSCMLGTYHATLGMKRLISYSDEKGEHSEEWSVSRYHREAAEAVRLVFEAAYAIRKSKPSNVPPALKRAQ